jgi:hypothetical protein
LVSGAGRRKSVVALCVTFGIPLCLVAVYRDSLLGGAALMRGLVAPLAIAGFGTVLSRTGFEGRLPSRLAFDFGLPRRRVAVAAFAGLIVTQMAFVYLDHPAGPHLRLVYISGAVIAGGVVALLLRELPSSRHRLVGSAVVALGALSIVQFGDFYVDYMTNYRIRYVTETDGPVREMLEAVIDRSPFVEPSPQRSTPVVYLGFRLGVGDWGGYYWHFYLHKHHREDLLLRTINDTAAATFTHDRMCQLPAESLVATRIGYDLVTDALINRMIHRGEFVLDTLVRDVHQQPSYWLLRTTGVCRPE